MKIITIICVLAAVAIAQVSVPFAIVITPDNFPEDISWELFFRSNSQRIAQGTRSASGNIPAVEYLFRISDSFGDGICCANGQGSLALRSNNVNFFTSNGQYGSGLTVEFMLNADGTATLLNGDAPTVPESNGEFNIELVAAANFNPSGLESIVAALQASANRWEAVITGDLPDINGVDDLRITYDFSPIDGVSGTIGSAGPTRLRSGSLLPFEGVMTFDSADVGRLNSEELEALFLHEMGHVLGIGTLWQNLGCSQCENGNPLYNPTGQCAAAEQAFLNTPGRQNGAQLLIEQDGGGGTACGHFDELQFQSELMTGFLTVNPTTGISELSTITIATLEDMGYTVNYEAADSYSLPLGLSQASVVMDLSHDMYEGEIEVDTVDAEQELEFEDITQMVDSNSGVGTGAIVGIGLSAGVVAFGAMILFVKRRNNPEAHAKLVDENYTSV